MDSLHGWIYRSSLWCNAVSFFHSKLPSLVFRIFILSFSHLMLIGSSCAFTRTLCSSDSQLWTTNDEPVNRGNRHQINNVDTLWPPEKQNVEKWNWNCGCWKPGEGQSVKGELDVRWQDYNIVSECILFVFQLSRNYTLIVFMNYQR